MFSRSLKPRNSWQKALADAVPAAMSDSTKRFSSRVENYINYRPGYPRDILSLLQRECRLTVTSIIADIGSGTGILTELFLENGNPVFGVEPNPEMRAAAERLLGHYSNLRSIAGTAETTTLATQSVDIIVAGQAFHWFDRERTRPEFVRILKPGGWIVLVWNDRKISSTPFLQAYEALLQTYATDYQAIDHKQMDSTVIQRFFEPGNFKLATFANQQVFDFAGLQGRLLSSSYAPESGHPRHDPMLAELAAIFQKHQQNGNVLFEYNTLVYYGQLQTG
ncbi:MAG: Methyltransferase [Pedosphaera sp.]|nr:Methyltransferase [Pedosphaera sp.]